MLRPSETSEPPRRIGRFGRKTQGCFGRFGRVSDAIRITPTHSEQEQNKGRNHDQPTGRIAQVVEGLSQGQ